MNDQDKHRWKKVNVPDDMKDTFSAKYICARGDCGCEKLVSYSGGYKHEQYSRGNILMRERPDCYGDTPISQQNNID